MLDSAKQLITRVPFIVPAMSLLPLNTLNTVVRRFLVVSLLSYTSQTISIIFRSKASSACRLQYLSIKQV